MCPRWDCSEPKLHRTKREFFYCPNCACYRVLLWTVCQEAFACEDCGMYLTSNGGMVSGSPLASASASAQPA